MKSKGFVIGLAACALALLQAAAPSSATSIGGERPIRDAAGRVVQADSLRYIYLPGTGDAGAVRLTIGDQGEVIAREPATLDAVQSLPAPAANAREPRPAGADVRTAEGYAAPVEGWKFAVYGSNIGGSGLFVADVDGEGTPEVVAGASSGGGFGGDDMWYIIRRTGADTYERIWTSAVYESTIKQLLVVDTDGDGVFEIFVALDDGTVEIHEGDAPGTAATIATGLDIQAMEIADVDGDGGLELLLTNGTALVCRSLAAPYAVEWSLATSGGTALATGQLDDDAALEIVVGKGLVIDGSSRTVQWNYINGFGAIVRCGDIDGDGRDEIVGASAWYKVTAFDAEIQTPKWEIPIDLDIGAMRLVNTDADAVPEIIVGEGQWGSILCFDAATRAQRWAIANPEHGVTDVAVADVNADGELEVLWGAGASSTGEDHLYVADMALRTIEWQTTHLDGPLNAVGVGDVDGDGDNEIAMITFSSGSGYDNGIIHLFDGATHELAWSGDSAPGSMDWTGVRSLEVGNVDDDAREEIVYTSSYIYDGKVVVFDGSTRVIKRESAGYDGNFFSALAIADVDQDGEVEIVAGQGREHTGAEGVYLIVFDGATMAEEWRSVDLGIYWGYVSDIAVADVDADGRPEIVAAMPGGRLYVYDGVTHQLDWLDSLAAYSVESADLDADGTPEILVGRASGLIEAYDGQTHALRASRTVGAGSITALRVTSTSGAGPWLLASDGERLEHFFWAGTAVDWESPALGTQLGRCNQLVAEDFDGDGSMEFLAGSHYALFQYDFPATGPNVEPTLDTIADVTVVEDAAVQSVALSGISAGAAEEQRLTVTASSSNTGVIPHPTVTYTSPGATGSVRFTPAANANGTATIAVTVDDGQAANNTVTRSFLVTVTSVNDAPQFTSGGRRTVTEDAGAQSLAGWATAISAGPADEAGQLLDFLVTSDNVSLFSEPPAVSAGGTLTYTAAADAFGSAIVTVRAHDDGGTSDGGADTSAAQTFMIDVTAVNDPPTLDAVGDVTIDEDAGQQTVNLGGIAAGPGESQTLTVTATSSNIGLIPHPAVTYTSPAATGTLTFTPVANASGTATLTVRVGDGQASDGTATRTFQVTVNALNDAPTGVALSGNLVAQNAAAGTVVGTLSTADIDAGDSFTYSLVPGTGDADNASFEVAGSELRVLTPPDFRVKNPYSVRVRSADAGGLSTEQAFTISTPEYALWTRSDTGQAALWRLRPDTGALIDGTYLYLTSGVGRPWQATGYEHVSDTDGYVLWTRSDTGQAALWQVDPSQPAGAAQLKRSVFLYLAGGVGRPWQATSYQHVSDTDGYVLWARSDTGQAALWRIDPSLPAGAAQLKRSLFLYSATGVGRPWQATSYQHVSDTEGYVLWTRSDTGQAVLWQIDPGETTGATQLKRSVFLYVKSGVGGPWQATSYTHVSATEGYVLWTRSDTGQAAVWKLDPSQATGSGQLAGSWYLYAKAGVGGPWQATSHVRLGPVSAAAPDSGEQREAAESLAR